MFRLLLFVATLTGCSVTAQPGPETRVLLSSTHVVDGTLRAVSSQPEVNGKQFVYELMINNVLAETADIAKYVNGDIIYVEDFEQNSPAERLPPHHEQIEDLVGKRVIAFLGCEDYLGVRSCSFAAHDAQVISEWNSALSGRVQQEWNKSVPPACGVEDGSQLDLRVRGIIDRLGNRDTAKSAVDELIKIGDAAVPYLIKYMDDQRAYAGDWLVLTQNGVHAQYRPELLLDAIAAITGYLTGESPVFVYNGGVDEKVRENALKAWRYYALENICK